MTPRLLIMLTLIALAVDATAEKTKGRYVATAPGSVVWVPNDPQEPVTVYKKQHGQGAGPSGEQTTKAAVHYHHHKKKHSYVMTAPGSVVQVPE